MKYVLSAILIMYCSISYSQINKHEWLAGGSASFQSNSYGPPPNSTSYTIDPDFGYFVINNLAIGLELNYLHSKIYSTDIIQSFTIAPFVRYYLLPSAKKVNVFLQADYQHSSSKSTNMGFPYASHYYAFGIKAGPAIFLNPHVALEITLNYSHAGKGYYPDKTFSSAIGFQIHLGSIKRKREK